MTLTLQKKKRKECTIFKGTYQLQNNGSTKRPSDIWWTLRNTGSPIWIHPSNLSRSYNEEGMGRPNPELERRERVVDLQCWRAHRSPCN